MQKKKKKLVSKHQSIKEELIISPKKSMERYQVVSSLLSQSAENCKIDSLLKGENAISVNPSKSENRGHTDDCQAICYTFMSTALAHDISKYHKDVPVLFYCASSCSVSFLLSKVRYRTNDHCQNRVTPLKQHLSVGDVHEGHYSQYYSQCSVNHYSLAAMQLERDDKIKIASRNHPCQQTLSFSK